MINLQVIIDRLKAVTPYTNVDWAAEAIQDLFEESELPCIKVGYHSIQSEDMNKDLSYGAYRINNEDLRQTFVIRIVSKVESYKTVWDNIYGCNSDNTPRLLGWNPASLEINTSPINFIKEDTIGLSQGKIVTQAILAIGTPTFTFNY